MAIFSKAALTKFAWAAGTLAALELFGLFAGSLFPWYLATPLIGAAGALGAYLLDEKL